MTKLPKKLQQMIEQKAEAYAKAPCPHGKFHYPSANADYRNGATELALAVLAEAEKVVGPMRELRTEWLESKGELPEKMKTKLNQADFALADWQKFVGGGEND